MIRITVTWVRYLKKNIFQEEEQYNWSTQISNFLLSYKCMRLSYIDEHTVHKMCGNGHTTYA